MNKFRKHFKKKHPYFAQFIIWYVAYLLQLIKSKFTHSQTQVGRGKT
jgi:hypothetical protein